MSNEVYAFVLKNTLNEIKNVCPDVSHAFVFKEDGKILAKDENTNEKTITKTVDAFNAITERANTIGGLESITFHGTNGRVNIACINDFCLTTIASKEADEKYVNTLTRVLVPTVLKLVEKIRPASIDNDTFTTEQIEPEVNPEPLLPEPPVNQFIVENLGGLLVPSDTVRIDSAVMVQWKNLYADKKIEEVDVETLNGKTTRCNFKPIKGSKYEGKGIIQIPEKIQLTLQTKKGELVMVKPVVE
jgi:predicted regulator of Ras-like GTPase activity (Roadblock/LC7/MglB family)